MRIKEMTCTNSNGDSLTISKSNYFKPIEDFNTTGLKVNNTYISNYRSHGAVNVASQLGQRDISLLFFIDVKRRGHDWIQAKRDEVFKVFNPIYNPIRIQFKTEKKELYLEADVETTPLIEPDRASTNHIWHKVLVQFTCGNPFFHDVNEKKAEIALWVPAFEFPLEIPEEGIEMGYRSESLIVNVNNDGQIETGMTIKFKAQGTLTNPSLFNVNKRQLFKINRTLSPGEIIIINTRRGKKRAESNINGNVSDIFSSIQFGSKWLQLDVGDNLFRYDADTNIENLEVAIYFTPQYIGV